MINIKWNDKLDSSIETNLIDINIDKNEHVNISISTTSEVFKYILEKNVFHLSKDVIINQSRKNFNDIKPVEIDLALSPQLEKVLKDSGELSKETLIRYLSDEIYESCKDTENWYVLNVKQEEELPEELKVLGSVKTGFSTKWNESLYL